MTDDRGVHEQLRMVIKMTEANQEGLRALEDITRQQAGIVDRQSKMIDRMWDQVQPILAQHKRKQQIKNAVMEKLITGGAWGIATGLVFLLYKGMMYMIHQDNGGV